MTNHGIKREQIVVPEAKTLELDQFCEVQSKRYISAVIAH